MDFADLQFMDGICEYVVVYEDGSKVCPVCDVQFLFLFDDRVTCFVCGQDATGGIAAQ